MKSPVTAEVINEQSGVLKEISFGIKKENYHIIFGFLRNQAYKDPIRAVIREYAANAADIHAQQKISQPFQITLPSELDATFRVRDFGKALTDSEIASIYCSYGESTKRDDNTQTGMLGLGSKSGFAYGDSFIVNSYRQGKLTTWNAYIDPSKEGKMAQMNVEATDQPDGLEIVIPVKGEDVYEFRQKAIQRVLPYFDVTPTITNITAEEQATLSDIRDKQAGFAGVDWAYYGSGESIAIMANVAYPIDVDAFTDQEITPSIKKFLRGGMRVKFANGSLEFAISREALQYTPHTKKNILARLNEIGDEIATMAEAKFNGCKTLWESKLLWQEVFRTDGSLYSVRELFDKKLKFNGFPLNDSKFDCHGWEGMEVACYSKGYRYRSSSLSARISRNVVYEIPVSVKNLIVENDTEIFNGIVNRVVGLIETGKYDTVYVLKFADSQVKANWMKHTGFDYPLTSLATLPKEPLSKYYGGIGTTSGFGSIKHTSKEFTFSKHGTPDNAGGYDTEKNSDYWLKADVDLANDEGVYLAIDRFQYKDENGYYKDADKLVGLLNNIAKVGIEMPDVIYGFKPTSTAKVKNNPKMVDFWTWLDKAIADFFASHPKLEQEYVNRQYHISQINAHHYNLVGLGNMVKKWNSVQANSQLLAFFENLNAISKYDEGKLALLSSLVGSYSKYRPKLKPSFDAVAEYKKLESKYPLLFKTTKELHSVVSDKTWIKPLEDYVTLVDLATP
jgi:hypothetical protein